MQFEKYAKKCKWRMEYGKETRVCLPNMSNTIIIGETIYGSSDLCREENCGPFSMLVCMVEDIKDTVNDLQKQLQENGTLKKFIVSGKEIVDEDN